MHKDIHSVLTKLGFSEKEIAVYCALLEHGPSPVRGLAAQAGINRGTTYDILRSLQDRGLAAYYHKAKHQYFVAEDPEKLLTHLENQRNTLEGLKKTVAEIVPELQGMQSKGGGRPVVMYYTGDRGIRTILEDVLATMAQETSRTYDVYSSAHIRNDLYRSFPNFTKQREKKKIFVRVIALGEGGETAGLSERRWLPTKQATPTYTIIYGAKTAHISADAQGNLQGVRIDDMALATTERLLFERLWQTLKS